MLGKEFTHVLSSKKMNFISTAKDIDITKYDDVVKFVIANKPRWIINCAAYTAVDRAEEERALARSINSLGAFYLAKASKLVGATLIHFSTDYVFGSGIPKGEISETAPTQPESTYGKTKLEGEEKIKRTLKNFYIIRTSWLFGLYGKNFVKTMLKLLKERRQVKVINDQIGTPTWTYDLVDFVINIVNTKTNSFGTYHFSNEGTSTWYSFAKKIQSIAFQLGIDSECEIIPCKSKDYPTKAKRPSWSVLSKSKIKTTFGWFVPNWKDSLLKYLKEEIRARI
jgi:dTDP-4-dehydrorhamnose reductase